MDGTPDAAVPALGARIGEVRRAHGLTLAQLAEVCGVSEATLSRFENGKTAVGAHHLLRIAQYLRIDVGTFFRDGPRPMATGMRALTRADTGPREQLARFSSEILGAALSQKSMHPAINTVTARSLEEVGGLTSHGGEEFLFVLDGDIILESALYKPTRLGPGDSLYFDGSMPHAYLAAGDDPARVLVIVGPAGATS